MNEERKPKVFVVMQPMARDRETGEFTPKYDLTPAEVYGELVILLPRSIYGQDPDWMVDHLTDKMDGFNDEDHILAVGDPRAIGIVTNIAAQLNDNRVSFLTWNGRDESYESYFIDMTI